MNTEAAYLESALRHAARQLLEDHEYEPGDLDEILTDLVKDLNAEAEAKARHS